MSKMQGTICWRRSTCKTSYQVSNTIKVFNSILSFGNESFSLTLKDREVKQAYRDTWIMIINQPWWLGSLELQLSYSVDSCPLRLVNQIQLGTIIYVVEMTRPHSLRREVGVSI